MTKYIVQFQGEHFFLSNFYAAPIKHLGLLMPTVEHAFQASKSKSKEDHKNVSLIVQPGLAKKYGKSVKLRSNWEEIKVNVMLKLVRKKFEIPVLREALLDTGNAKLVEGNYWGDVEWGVCRGKGKNKLGKILMKVRKEIQEQEDAPPW